MQVHHQSGHVVHLRGVDLADKQFHPSSICTFLLMWRTGQQPVQYQIQVVRTGSESVQARHASTEQKQHQTMPRKSIKKLQMVTPA